MSVYHKHGMTRSSEFSTWNHMKDRCSNPNNKSFPYYGGKGIKVCGQWENSFPQFLEDMGRKPTRFYTIERIDSSKGYTPENCRWATMKEQNRNKSNSRILELYGVKRSVAEWAEHLQLNVKTIRSRLRYGWSVERALSKDL